LRTLRRLRPARSALFPYTTLFRSKGYDQILWTDAGEHKYAEEIGTMNVFFVIDGKAVTPDLTTGTTLAGITRDSAMTVLRDMGVNRKSTRLNSSHVKISYAVFCLK